MRLYPWFEFSRSLLFWQATWFLYFQNELSAAEAILLYAVFDISATILEVPSGYMSDRLGRRMTLMCASVISLIGLILLGVGSSFLVFALAQFCLGAGMAFISGTNTALLYESLDATRNTSEMEAHSLRAWRYGFVAFAVSAVSGGVMALWWAALPFFGSAIAYVALIWIAMRFIEPPHALGAKSELQRLRDLSAHFREPVLLWLFALSVLMYGYSHIPFVFGQPFISEALSAANLSIEAPLVSGVVTALMMCVSLLASLIAPGLKSRIGLGGLVLIAFAMQAGLALVLALSGSVIAIGFLLLRMVPDAFSTPFIVARIQPLLGDDSRATFMSVKSLCGRIVFAASLWLAASVTDAIGVLSRADLQSVLLAYAIGGFVCLTVLLVTARNLTL
ncbi:MAG: MFS transporter [Aliishimia sp.]